MLNCITYSTYGRNMCHGMKMNMVLYSVVLVHVFRIDVYLCSFLLIMLIFCDC